LAATGSALAGPRRDVYARGSKTLPLRSDSELSARAAEIVNARQFHHLRSTEPLVDVCANINLDTVIGIVDLLGIPVKDILDLHICLCVSALPLEIGVSAQIDALINKYGGPLLNAVIKLLIDLSKDHKTCTYPPYSTPFCSQDPCDFNCPFPFQKEGDQCVCEKPYVLCNGQCVASKTGTCSSAGSHPYARRMTLREEAQASCGANEEVCGVYGGSYSAYDCVDTKKNLESCGGCMIPNPFLLASSVSPVGVDCTSIDHVDSVSCVSGQCIVESCEKGWEVSEGSAGCVAPTSSSAQLLSIFANAVLPIKRAENEA